MEIVVSNRDLLIVTHKEVPVAEIHLDFLHQIETLVFLPVMKDEDIQTMILRRAASHVRQYTVDDRYRRRRVDGVIIKERKLCERNLTASLITIEADFIPQDFFDLGRDELFAAFEDLGIRVLFAKYDTLKEALDDVVQQIGTVTYELKEEKLIDKQVVVFSSSDKPFTYWLDVDEKDSLRLVPPYHPVNRKSRSGRFLLNGATGAVISSDVIDAGGNPYNEEPTGIWPFETFVSEHHPYKAEGQHLKLSVHKHLLRTEKGIEELIRYLKATLDLNDLYIGVSGGFGSPLISAHNVIVELGIRSPYPHAGIGSWLARGSENHCVWAYRVLKEEGVLNESYIPDWFLPENWLGIYESAGL